MSLVDDICEAVESGVDEILGHLNEVVDYVGENYIKPIGDELQNSEAGVAIADKIIDDLEVLVEKTENLEFEDVVKKLTGIDVMKKSF